MLTRIELTPKSEKEWLSFRENDLTSTEVSALFGASPYQTQFELYHHKKGTLERDGDFTGDRIVWGRRLESAIAYGIAEDMGLIVEPMKNYMRLDGLRIGSSFDFKVVGIVPECDWFGDDGTAREMFLRHGPGIMEVKNVDGIQFRRAWIDGEESIEAPPHIEFQAQHQLLVSDLKWVIIAPLVGGNTPRPMIRIADAELHALILIKIAKFWAMFDANEAPEPNFSKDARAIGKLYVDNDGSAIDLSDDPRVFELCATYKDKKAASKEMEEAAQAAKAELLTIIKGAKTVQVTGFSVSAGTNKAVYKAYDREASERATITISKIPAARIEAEQGAYRNVRITDKRG